VTHADTDPREKYLIAIRLKIQTKSSHKIHRSELLRLDFVNLNSLIAINGQNGKNVPHYVPAAEKIIIRNQ